MEFRFHYRSKGTFVSLFRLYTHQILDLLRARDIIPKSAPKAPVTRSGKSKAVITLKEESDGSLEGSDEELFILVSCLLRLFSLVSTRLTCCTTPFRLQAQILALKQRRARLRSRKETKRDMSPIDLTLDDQTTLWTTYTKKSSFTYILVSVLRLLFSYNNCYNVYIANLALLFFVGSVFHRTIDPL